MRASVATLEDALVATGAAMIGKVSSNKKLSSRDEGMAFIFKNGKEF